MNYLNDVFFSLIPFLKISGFLIVVNLLVLYVSHELLKYVQIEQSTFNRIFKGVKQSILYSLIVPIFIGIVFSMVSGSNVPKNEITNKQHQTEAFIKNSERNPDIGKPMENNMRPPKETDAERKKSFDDAVNWSK